MKQFAFIAGALVCLFTSCTKEPVTVQKKTFSGTGCIEQLVVPISPHAIDAAAVPIVNVLFKNNNIDNSNFRYYDYVHDTLQTLYEPYARLDEKVVRVEQYANGLRILTGYMSYVFLEDKLSGVGGELSLGTSLDTKPDLSLNELRTLFLNSAEEYDGAGDKYKDTCLAAEFGYFNLNAGASYMPEKLVKAWRVVIKNSEQNSQYPQAYYGDDGIFISYDNGIRTFK